MTTAIEEAGSNLVARELVDRAQRDPDEVGLLRVFTKRDAQLKTLYLLRDVDKPLGIALNEVEASLFLTRQRIVGGMVFREVDQLLVHDIAHEADAVVGVVMIDVAVDLVLVDTLGEQFSDDEEDLRTGTVVGEAARVCHHTTVDGDGKGLTHVREGSQLPDDAEHQLAGAGRLRKRDDDICRDVGIQVVVDEDTTGRTAREGCLHLVDTTGGIEVEAYDEVGNLKQHVTLVTMLVVAHYLLAVRHPRQEVWVLVGHNDSGILATPAQVLSHAQRGTYRITVRTLMTDDQDGLSMSNQLVHLGQLISR